MKKAILIVAVPLFFGCGSDHDHAEMHEDQAHVHASEEAHDHSGHDHTGHDHDGHDHSEHDHSGHDHHDHAQGEAGAYGDPITKEGAMSTDKMVALMGDKDELNCKVQAEVITSCKKKGCWMDVKMEDGSSMKVTFKDYGFFVPKEGLQGKTVYMEGKAVREEVSVEVLKHYAEDAGKSEEEIAAITEPGEGITFIADGVIIED